MDLSIETDSNNTQVQFIKSELLDINLQFWENSLFFPSEMDIITRN